MSWDNWGDTEPSLEDERCVQIWNDHHDHANHQWVDFPCDRKDHGEKPVYCSCEFNTIEIKGGKLFVLFPEKTGKQGECETFCSEKGGRLPAVLKMTENTQLVGQMQQYDVKITWIGLCF
eukprot:sb/3476252/